LALNGLESTARRIKAKPSRKESSGVTNRPICAMPKFRSEKSVLEESLSLPCATPLRVHLASSVGGLMRKSEVAQLCRVSVRTIDQWIAEKKIPSIKVGRNVRFRWPAVEVALMRYERRAIH